MDLTIYRMKSLSPREVFKIYLKLLIGKNNKTGRKAPKGKRGFNEDEGMDSHTESDEAVDDRGAMF